MRILVAAVLFVGCVSAKNFLPARPPEALRDEEKKVLAKRVELLKDEQVLWFFNQSTSGEGNDFAVVTNKRLIARSLNNKCAVPLTSIEKIDSTPSGDLTYANIVVHAGASKCEIQAWTTELLTDFQKKIKDAKASAPALNPDELDSDGDGVVDAADACPSNQGDAAHKGCPG